MAQKKEILHRRDFLIKSGSFLMGGILGLNGFSKAFTPSEAFGSSEALAFGVHKDKPLYQPCIALIIDDIGFSFSRARQFLELRVPMTFSILPRLPNSQDLAHEIRSEGHEIMLHQPMEPYNSELDPGPGALYVGDRADRIVRIMEENISGVPFATGVNNHMGSRFTERPQEIKEVLRTIKNRGLFFVDSLTSSRSMAYKAARRLHMATAYRNIFLDNRLDVSAILSQLHMLKRYALKYGHAIGIGHPFPETAKAIGHFLAYLEGSNISLVHVSRLTAT